MTKRMFTLAEAARLADTTVEELQTAVRDGLLRASRLQNTGDVHVSEADLADWVRRSRPRDLPGRPRRKKVLILGDDLLLTGTLKLEFQRDGRLDVKSTSWGKDAVLLIHHYNADLFVADLTPSPTAPDEALFALSKNRKESARVIGYSILSYEEMKSNELFARRLATLRPDAFVTRSEGMRGLLVECFKQLGLLTRTVVIRRQA